MTGELGRGFGGLIEQATSPAGLIVLAVIVVVVVLATRRHG